MEREGSTSGTMAGSRLLIWVFSLTAWSLISGQPDEAPAANCSSQLLEQLSAALKGAADCAGNQTSLWSPERSAALMSSMRTVLDGLHQQQMRECEQAEPRECPAAEVPENGGLVCVTLNNKRFCKAFCNHGYDFDFLRSRTISECSQMTRYKWLTQYVGGNTLAQCNKAEFQLSAPKSTYFPRGSDCLTTKSQTQASFIQSVITDLRGRGEEGEPQGACLVCGR